MGRATITGEQGDGRYTIEIDLGTGPRDARAAEITAHLVTLEARISTATLSVAAAQTLYDTARADLESQIDAWAAANEIVVTGSPRGKAHEQALRVVFFLGAQLSRKQSALAALQMQRTQQQKLLTSLQNLPLLQTRGAWCIDLTESATGAVATAEVPGESDLVLIKPGAPAWAAADGVLGARELLDPNQAFFNVAILPGWQKYLPTFRRGTILSLDRDIHRASVALAEHKSSAQRLPVDQQSLLLNIPVTYMTCHSEVFEVGDQVIVMFDGQDQQQPRVIGFVTDPKGCTKYTLTYRTGRGFASAAALPGSQTIIHEVYKNRDAPQVTAITPFFDSTFYPDLAQNNGGSGRAAVFRGWHNDTTSTFDVKTLSRLDTSVQASAQISARYEEFNGASVPATIETDANEPDRVPGVTRYRKVLIFPSSAETVSGPQGTYRTGWYFTFVEATQSGPGLTVVRNRTVNSTNIVTTYVLQPAEYNPANGGVMYHDLMLTDISDLYAVFV